MTLKERIISGLQVRRQRILDGGINCIPCPFERFRDEWPGIEQRRYYVISGATKSSKTQLMTFLFLINTILFVYKRPGLIKLKIFYFPLEETKEAVTLRFMAFLLNYTSKGKFRICPTDLESTDERKPLSQEALDAMNSPEFNAIMALYEEIVEFREEQNATGMYKILRSYGESRGKTFFNEVEYDVVDEFGNKKHVKSKEFDHYEPEDPNEYVIAIADHVGCLRLEKDIPTLKQNIERWSDYCIFLRNRFNMILCNIQQQNSETTNLEAFKANKVRPTKDGLKDSKKPGEDCNVLIGITNPYTFELSEYLGYDIKTLKDNARFMEIVLNRNGRANGICPLYFDGAIDKYAELPLPNDTVNIEKVYNFIKQQSKLFFMRSITKTENVFAENTFLNKFASYFSKLFN